MISCCLRSDAKENYLEIMRMTEQKHYLTNNTLADTVVDGGEYALRTGSGQLSLEEHVCKAVQHGKMMASQESLKGPATRKT